MQKNCLAAALLALAVTSVHAQTATPGVDQRQVNQEKRIEQGVASGQLTPREAARLERGQERVEKMEEKAKADGKVTPEERARLKKAQDRQSAAIYKEKHDRQTDRNHDGHKDRPARKH
jgi:hypothetical protein